jgi:predicted transcriptional regulator
MDVKILERLGLTKGEIKAYLALLELGSSTTGPIETKSGVSRSKLYGIFEKLEKKGFTSHMDKGGVRYFQAVEPSKIMDYLHDRQDELKTLEDEFQRTLPSLQELYLKRGAMPSFKVYYGVKGVMLMHDHIYMKLKKGEGYEVLGVPAARRWLHLKFWKKDHRRREKAGIKCRMLYNRNVERELVADRNSYRLCDARYLPTPIVTPSYIMTYKDTTVIIIVSDEPESGEPISIEIVSQKVTDSFRAYFDEFWKRSKPFK